METELISERGSLDFRLALGSGANDGHYFMPKIFGDLVDLPQDYWLLAINLAPLIKSCHVNNFYSQLKRLGA